MNTLDIQAAIASLEKLEISDRTTSKDASASMKIFGNFNQCAIGLVSFSGETPWERHPDDELLYIQEGGVKITLLAEDGIREVTLQAGSVFIVPAGLWHNQLSQDGVKLLFITSREGNQESQLDDPRTELSAIA